MAHSPHVSAHRRPPRPPSPPPNTEIVARSPIRRRQPRRLRPARPARNEHIGFALPGVRAHLMHRGTHHDHPRRHRRREPNCRPLPTRRRQSRRLRPTRRPGEHIRLALAGMADHPWNGAPTATVDPLMPTASPNWSLVAPSDDVNSAVCDHVDPLKPNTYPAPCPLFDPPCAPARRPRSSTPRSQPTTRTRRSRRHRSPSTLRSATRPTRQREHIRRPLIGMPAHRMPRRPDHGERPGDRNRRAELVIRRPSPAVGSVTCVHVGSTVNGYTASASLTVISIT